MAECEHDPAPLSNAEAVDAILLGDHPESGELRMPAMDDVMLTQMVESGYVAAARCTKCNKLLFMKLPR